MCKQLASIMCMSVSSNDRLLRAISILCDSDKSSDEDYDPQLYNRLS